MTTIVICFIIIDCHLIFDIHVVRNISWSPTTPNIEDELNPNPIFVHDQKPQQYEYQNSNQCRQYVDSYEGAIIIRSCRTKLENNNM